MHDATGPIAHVIDCLTLDRLVGENELQTPWLPEVEAEDHGGYRVTRIWVDPHERVAVLDELTPTGRCIHNLLRPWLELHPTLDLSLALVAPTKSAVEKLDIARWRMQNSGIQDRRTLNAHRSPKLRPDVGHLVASSASVVDMASAAQATADHALAVANSTAAQLGGQSALPVAMPIGLPDWMQPAKRHIEIRGVDGKPLPPAPSAPGWTA